eukprot:6173812-Amphidinium_carterae.1
MDWHTLRSSSPHEVLRECGMCRKAAKAAWDRLHPSRSAPPILVTRQSGFGCLTCYFTRGLVYMRAERLEPGSVPTPPISSRYGSSS